MSFEFTVRIIGMIVFSILGAVWGSTIDVGTIDIPYYYPVLLGFVGALVGLILTPYLTTRPIKALRGIFKKISAGTLAAGLLGLTIGLVIAALLAFPLSILPEPLGKILPFIGVLLFGYFGVAVFIMRRNDIFNFVRLNIQRKPPEESGRPSQLESRPILMDTSVIIDGRIADVSRTGFLVGTLVIPRFVLVELQYIADSADSLRRQRGRRGMEVLAQLQKDTIIPVQISDMDVDGVKDVDDKLVVLARQMKCPIITNDYNLNRIAELQGVPVLNINELANSLKSLMLPGETFSVHIIQEGKEQNQGVGYLDDGTMVVIEDGKDFLQQEKQVIVTKVLQTAAGRMIFARPEEN